MNGGLQVSCKSEVLGGSVGQYKRMHKMKRPEGAGSQFDSLSLPGESFWMYRSKDLSGLA
jgi:hypothetical protein